MAGKTAFKRIDTAFAILFIMLIAFVLLHVTIVSDMGGDSSTKVLQITSELERYRDLERNLSLSTNHLRNESMNQDTKMAILDIELEKIENALHALGKSGLDVAGLTRLIEPYIQIHDTRLKIKTQSSDEYTFLAAGGLLDRTLQATLFVVRNNIICLGEELTATTASLNKRNDRSRQIAILVGLVAVLVFVPVRLLAGRAAANPIRALQAATHAVAEERWNAVNIKGDSDDAVGDLLTAFRSMADKLRESRQERANAFRCTMMSLVQTIEAKDEYTFNHSNNVSKYAELLARAYGLSEKEIEEITVGGLLHDIGKIGIPDVIINKPGKLTTEEFNTIAEHPVICDRIVKPLDGSEALIPQVRHHHEHWDGNGYPDGLRGEQIPLSARIIAVADVFEALTSKRPYRDKMSVEKAVIIMRQEAGSTLDPQLVEMFISEVLQKIGHLSTEPPTEAASNDSQTTILCGRFK